MSLYSISVPERLYQRLKQQAESQKQSLDDLVELTTAMIIGAIDAVAVKVKKWRSIDH